MQSVVPVIKYIKNFIVIVFLLLFASCTPKPKIPISNTLEIALGNKYSMYVALLNKSIEMDSTALLHFLKIDFVNDAAGYDHGYILYELMRKIGDKKIAKILQKMNGAELDNFSQYLEVGIDGNESALYELKTKYTLIFAILSKQKSKLQN